MSTANAFAVRTTEPILASWPKFSIATCSACRRLSISAMIASRVQYRYASTTLRVSPSRNRIGSYRGSSGGSPTQGPTPAAGAPHSVGPGSVGHRAVHTAAWVPAIATVAYSTASLISPCVHSEALTRTASSDASGRISTDDP